MAQELAKVGKLPKNYSNYENDIRIIPNSKGMSVFAEVGC